MWTFMLLCQSAFGEDVKLATALAHKGHYRLTIEDIHEGESEAGSMGSRKLTVVELNMTQPGRLGKNDVSFDGKVVRMAHRETKAGFTVDWDSATPRGAPRDAQKLYASLVGLTWSALLSANGTGAVEHDDYAQRKRMERFGLESWLIDFTIENLGSQGPAETVTDILWALPQKTTTVGSSFKRIAGKTEDGRRLRREYVLHDVHEGVATLYTNMKAGALLCSGQTWINVEEEIPKNSEESCVGESDGRRTTVIRRVTWEQLP